MGGAIGACTCVITSVHYRAREGYGAEIDVISLDEWRSELIAIRDAFMLQPSDEDTPDDIEELEAEKNAAQEKFRAVYRDNSLEIIERLLTDPNLGLPESITRAMSVGKPIVIEEINARTLRNNVKRYLVGREQHKDGQYWPLISRVRIYGSFKELKNGVVLVDLPGLNDPNPAREAVTKKYLEEARYIWLICNSQTGIDPVFTGILRKEGLLRNLFYEGRLNVFSVIATRIDEMNLEAVLEQMGINHEEFDGDVSVPLEFRRGEIVKNIKTHLNKIAENIVADAERLEHHDAFFDLIRSIPIFSVSTAAYLHTNGHHPLFQGMKLPADKTDIPRLIDHLHSITLEHSYKKSVEASTLRLQMLFKQVHHFFLDEKTRIEQGNEQSRQDWELFCQCAASSTRKSIEELKLIQIQIEGKLVQRCDEFNHRLADFDDKVGLKIQDVFNSWEGTHWRTLQAAVKRGGEYFSRTQNREINLNRDIANAYLSLIPFLWDEFFGSHLSTLVQKTVNDTKNKIQSVVDKLNGSMNMLNQQTEGIQENLNRSLEIACESFQLRSELIVSDLKAQIQRTRQSLNSGMIERASVFMNPAYSLAKEENGTGIKRRILDILKKKALQESSALFVDIRNELSDGLALLKSSMKQQLSSIVLYGEQTVNQIQQNTTVNRDLTPQQLDSLNAILNDLPRLEPKVVNVESFAQNG